MESVLAVIRSATLAIKSTVPVGYTQRLREKTGSKTLFSPEFLRESKAVYEVRKTGIGNAGLTLIFFTYSSQRRRQ